MLLLTILKLILVDHEVCRVYKQPADCQDFNQDNFQW